MFSEQLIHNLYNLPPQLINRPGVAGAVLQTYCHSLIDSFIDSVITPARWKRKQEIQGSPPEVALEGEGTADYRIKSGLLRVRKIRKCAGKCRMSKIGFELV